MTRFEAFSTQHLLLVALCAVGLVLVPWWGRRHRGAASERRVRRSLAVGLGAVAVAMQAYQLTPGDFALATSLPLQLCDLATVTAVAALWTRDPRFAAFTYYVGLTLTLQAVLTPSLAETFPHPRFFGFWALHLGVVWSAAYLVWGLGLRPTWGRYRLVVAVVGLWAVAMLGFNELTGTNYGYLTRKPPVASALDLLPGWPVYVVVVAVVAALVWAAMTWPFEGPFEGARTRVSPGDGGRRRG